MGHEYRHPGLVPGFPGCGGCVILSVVRCLRVGIVWTGVCGLSRHQAYLLQELGAWHRL
jgi:hypothetical protein